MPIVLSESTMDVLARVALHFLWQGAVLGLAAACLLHVLTIRTARARYALFCGLLLLLAACPLATWRNLGAGSVAIVELAETPTDEDLADAASAGMDTLSAQVDVMHRSTIPAAGTSPLLWTEDSRLRLSDLRFVPLRGWIATVWLKGICYMAARLLLGSIGVHRIVRQRTAIPRELTSDVERLSQRLAFRVRPAVHAVDQLSQAMAVGILKPMVMLPATWITELPGEVLEAVIAHELAHLRRWDLPVNLLQRLVETVLFFHPAVWWCSRRMRAEREMCCDELAQAAIGNRVVYAKALAYLAHRQCSGIEPLLAAGIGGSKMLLLERIRNVLGITPDHRGRLYGPSCTVLGAAVASLAWIAATELPSLRQTEIAPAHAEQSSKPPTATTAEPVAQPKTAGTNSFNATLEPSVEPNDAVGSTKPLTLENLKLQTYRDWTLDETIKTAIANSKVLRSLEAHRQQALADSEAGRTDFERSLADYELAVLNLVADVEAAYWELTFAFRNLETGNTAMSSARHTWQQIYAAYRAGSKGGEASAEAQAREQFYQFKSQAQTMLTELSRAENRLRYLAGLAASDGQLIRPIDRPQADKVKFDWFRLTQDALAYSPDLRRQRSRVKQQELELIATTRMLPRELRRKGIPEDSLFQEWSLGLQASIPVGLREKLATLRAHQLKLAREKAKLQDQELEVSHQLADAMRQLEYSYALSQTNMNRALAADRQVEAMQASFSSDSVTLDQLLEAQRRRAEAQTSYYRTLHDYQRAILTVQYHRGSLL